MLTASYTPYRLQFSSPILTSRGGMEYKNGYIITISENGFSGKGECSYIEGLSPDNMESYQAQLEFVCSNINDIKSSYHELLEPYPSIRFGVEMALLELSNKSAGIYFKSDFTKGNIGISINGLLWMGQKEYLIEQIHKKINLGFKCLKMKVGALPFEQEIQVLSLIREQFTKEQIELRLDANGAFMPEDALKKLDILSKFDIHSIEQPIKPGQWQAMSELVKNSPIPIALDEELIGIYDPNAQSELLNIIQPNYVILKPSLLGGFHASESWIKQAESKNILWWATSALESNLGLNAIAQWIATKNIQLPQGLGTGGLYTNNFATPLYIIDGILKSTVIYQ